MSTWYEHRFNFYGCHVIAYIGNRAVMQGEIDRSGFMPDVCGIKVFKDTEEYGWELEQPFSDCVLFWEESEFRDINCSEAKPGDYAVIGTHKYKITEKHDNSFILEGLESMDIHTGVIDYCLTRVGVLPQAAGWYTDRDNRVLYLSKSGDWYTFSQEGKPEFNMMDESDLRSLINVRNLKMPEWDED